VNANGIQDAGEPGIPGVHLSIPGKNVTTNSSGYYLLDTLSSGFYTVVIPASDLAAGGPLDGFTPSSALIGAPDADSNGTLNAGGAVQASVNLPANSSDMTIDFGFIKPTSYELAKKTVTLSPVAVNKQVHFQITIHNTGQTWITVLPLSDTYDTNFLTYGWNGSYATPASDDNVNDGTLNWTDVTGSGAIAPGATLTVDLYFTSKADTTLQPNQVTINHAYLPQQGTLVDPDGPDHPIPAANTPETPKLAQDVIQIVTPTGAALAQAGAAAAAEGVLISWVTADESGILGFNVLRGTTAADLQPVTSELFVAQAAGMTAGAAYSFVDAVAPGDYYYALEVIGLDGSITRIDLGPVSFGR
jgi:hypothetical protein